MNKLIVYIDYLSAVHLFTTLRVLVKPCNGKERMK